MGGNWWYRLTGMMLAVAVLEAAVLPGAVMADGEGSARLRFEDTKGNVVEGDDIHVPTDTRGTWTILYTVGADGMAHGGGIWIKKLGWLDFHFGFCMQMEDPTQEDYVTCRTTSKTGKVENVAKQLGRYFKEMNMMHLVVSEGRLVEGDQIIIEVGDRSGGGPGSMTTEVAWPDRKVFIQSDTDGDGNYVTLPEPMRVSFMPKKAVRFEVVAPSIVEVGKTFSIQVRAEDVNSNVQPAFSRTPDFAVEGEADGLGIPRTSTLPMFRKGILLQPFTAVKPGVYYVRARGEGDMTGTSNPIRVVEKGTDQRLYWGDTHVHTLMSDGTDDLEQNYLFARDVARLDFFCPSDHLGPTKEWMKLDGMLQKNIRNTLMPPITLEAWWERMLDAADKFNDPGRFVSFYAYEWSGRSNIGGDHIPILTERAPLPASCDLKEVYRILEKMDRGDNVMISPHVGGRIGNWNWHSPQVEAAAEVASVHGHFEWFGQEALQRGYKVALMGAGDNHHGRPAYSIWHRIGRMKFKKRNYGCPGAISGVYTHELTRRAVIKAFRQRRVFATTGHRPIVEFRIDETSMGGDMTTSSPPVIRADVWGTGPIDRIDLIRNQKRVHRYRGERRHESLSLTDRTVPPGDSYYYIRIRQRDGELAWSSPIFVKYTGPDTGSEARAKLPAWNDDGRIEEWLKRRRPMPKDYTAELEEALGRRAPNRFGPLHQVEWVEHPRGDYAVFLTTDRQTKNAPTRIRYYPGFTEERMYIYAGFGDYGPIRK